MNGPLPFRKKPVLIRAMRFVRSSQYPAGTNIFELMNWLTANRAETIPRPPDVLGIVTLEGTMAASIGDWIIQGVAGEFYPCKPDIFEATYQEADADVLKDELRRIATKAYENDDSERNHQAFAASHLRAQELLEVLVSRTKRAPEARSASDG